MSITEKLNTIETNQEKVYDTGYKVGYFDSGYEIGYTDGHDTGYTEGQEEGHTAGYEEGRTAGYTEGQEAGHTAGYEEGHDAGYTEGQEAGHTAGYEEGHNTGYIEGRESIVGKSVEKTVSGEYIKVNDVSEIPHELKVNLTSGGGKNLWSHGDQTFEKIIGKSVDLKAGKTYSFSAFVVSTDTTNDVCIVLGKENEVYFGAFKKSVRSSFTFTPPNDISELWLYASVSAGHSKGHIAIFKDIMLEEISGDNLFDINSTEIEDKRRLSCTVGSSWSNSSDGSDGFNVSHYISVESYEKYMLVNFTANTVYYCWYDKDKAFISGGSCTSGETLKSPANACYFRFDYPTTDTNVTFCELHEPSPYEPYKKTLTDYSGVSFNTYGKNLLNQAEMKTGTQSGVTLEYLEDEDCFLLNGTAESTTNRFVTYIFKEGVQNANYTISTTYISGTIETEGSNALVYLAESEINTGGSENWLNTRLGNNNNSTTKKLNKKYISAFWLYLNVGVKFNNYKFRIQLEHGSQSTPYEKFKCQTLSANADGTVEGVEYLSPYMYMTTDNPNVTINATYHKSYGMQTEYDRFWDSYQDGGKRTNYSFGFSGRGWTDETFKPKYPNLPPFEGQTYMFQDARMSEIDIDLQFTLIANIDYMFAYNSNLKRVKSVTLHASATGGDSCFRDAIALEDVTFKNEIPCSFNFQWSTKLSKATILNIFEHLSSTVTGQTLTLSKTAVTNAFGSTTATEWTNLVATKTNWTISLV